MSPSHVVEPTYRQIKQHLMEGKWPLGQRLEAVRLADDLGVSMTPVRDSLNRLVGERLVDLRPGEGFRVAHLSERILRDLFEFNAALLVFAIQASRSGEKTTSITPSDQGYAVRIAALFDAIAACIGNAVHREAIAALSDRLHAVRRLDPTIFPDCEDEARQIATAFGERLDKDILRLRLIAYHERRKQAASQYIHVLEQQV
jgi:DNA-binding FadR family transcriptional regulator